MVNHEKKGQVDPNHMKIFDRNEIKRDSKL